MCARDGAAEHHTPSDEPKQYYCEPHTASSRYYVFAVRSRDPAPANDPKWVGSSLVGWYAFRRKDGSVVEWNIADEGPGPVLTRSAGKRR